MSTVNNYQTQNHNGKGSNGHLLQSSADMVTIGETVMYHHNGECLLGQVTGKAFGNGQHAMIVDDKVLVTHIV